MTMFVDQTNIAAAVTNLSRPQMAILDVDEKSAYYLCRKKRDYESLTHEAQEGTMQ
jgi:hypothetical protein